ncbi:hypothetical protein M9H77_27898 [Catharanthus roseus]|uniref:Uncharacterized protein n=1 Tax=Catharanthus roseus TaxID=4058 RepID=A0ACC0AFP2_CATRO|nr:hypothetical protein M9H77_27898 [Catharanthus roseus]
MRTGITVNWIAYVNPCDTLYYLMYSSLGYDNASAATAGLSLTQSRHSMCDHSFSAGSDAGLDEYHMHLDHLSPCKLAHHTPGIVVLHYLITDERDLCPSQVRWNQSMVKIREPYKLSNQNPKSIKI